MKFTTALLKVLMPATDVITTGNEPFFNAKSEDKHSQRLVEFYEGTAGRAHAYIEKHDLDVPLFVGAFVNAYKSSKRNNQAYNGLLAFAKGTDWIDGVDMHIHHKFNKDITKSLDYISSRIRDDQRIIITEFSLVAWWGMHKQDDLSPDFKAKYDLLDINKVWQYVNYAVQHPRPIQEWNDWNKMTPWLRDRKHYMCKAFNIFTSYPMFWLAFYGIAQVNPGSITSTDPLWILNRLFVNATVKPKPDGNAYKRIWFLDDFKAIQTGASISCD